ncbi:MAG: hypothetical protein SFY92_06495 [Verrucomicrobiae bacterium]|nr:hypothetical protein [Verrucomicrobiae bacterium]
MPFSTISKKSGKTFILNSKAAKLKNGREVTLFYFSKEATPFSIDALPAGYEIAENSKTGLPILKKIR